MFVVVGVNSHIDILYINTILGQIVQLYKQAQKTNMLWPDTEMWPIVPSEIPGVPRPDSWKSRRQRADYSLMGVTGGGLKDRLHVSAPQRAAL